MGRNSTNSNSGSSRNRGDSTTQRMKYEIANEFGVVLGPDTTARQNGSVGGEITKQLVQRGKSTMGGMSGQNNANS